MNTRTAIVIAASVAELTDLASRFQAHYGKPAALTADTPPEVHRLYRAIFDKQRAIAQLLDAEALFAPTPRWPWWNHQAAIDPAAVSELAQEVNHLITCCAYFEVDPHSDLLPAIRSSQAAIAGMLQPGARTAAFRQRHRAFALDAVMSWN